MSREIQETEQEKFEREIEIKSEIFRNLETWFENIDFGFILESLIENGLVEEKDIDKTNLLIEKCIDRFLTD